MAPLRGIYPGRLKALRRWHESGERPALGEALASSPRRGYSFPRSIFSDQWIVLEDSGGNAPDIRAFAAVARRFRDALMSRYGAAGIAVPELISGHQRDGSPAATPHLAIVPLADAGFKYSEGRLMGLALVFPASVEDQRRKAERDWLAGLDDSSGGIAEWRVFNQLLSEIDRLELGGLGVWELSRTVQPSRKSLQPSRYINASRRWSSLTPILLDRYAKSRTTEARQEEIADIIAASCVNIGLPRPQHVCVYKHSAVKGVPSAYPSGNAPAWTRWTLPGPLVNRMLTHAVFEFAEPVCGPVILGAGRFAGLGLCMGDHL